MGKDGIYKSFRILLSSHYTAYVIHIYGRFVLYFHLHDQAIPEIACVRKQLKLKYVYC